MRFWANRRHSEVIPAVTWPCSWHKFGSWWARLACTPNASAARRVRFGTEPGGAAVIQTSNSTGSISLHLEHR